MKTSEGWWGTRCSVTSTYAKKEMSKETKKHVRVSHLRSVFSAAACDVSAMLSELV